MGKKIVFVAGSLLCSIVWGWQEHTRITDAALRQVVPDGATVEYMPLTAELRLQSIRRLKIHKGWSFPLKLGESPGKRVPIRALLAAYSDEPDWGVDQDLFEPSQYPELWKPDLAYIGTRTGMMSQSFRHMIFPGHFDWHTPLSSLQIPMHSVGEAPAAARRLFEVSQEFFSRGLPYWGYRFLAWSIHYVEDLHQPYHTRQLPSLSYVVLKWNGLIPHIDHAASTETIGYYHFAYEMWENRRFDETGSTLPAALSGDGIGDPLTGGIDVFLRDHTVVFSGRLASRVARLGGKAYPEFDPKGGRTAAQVVDAPGWYPSLKPGPALERLEQTTSTIFETMGRTVRRIMSEAQVGAPLKGLSPR